LITAAEITRTVQLLVKPLQNIMYSMVLNATTGISILKMCVQYQTFKSNIFVTKTINLKTC